MASDSPSTLEQFLESLPEWQDEQRARSMFASFAQAREVNPEAWDARFAFWRTLILEALDRGLLGRSVFRLERPEDLPFAFRRQHMTPLGLADVVAGMRERGLLRPTTALDGRTASPLAERLFWGPLRTSWGWVLGSSPAGSPPPELVAPGLLQRWADALTRHATQRARDGSSAFAGLFSLEGLQVALSEVRRGAGLGPVSCPEDARLLARYMAGRGSLVEARGVFRVRLAHESSNAPLVIAEEHRAAVQLQALVARLTEQTAAMERQIAGLQAAVLAALAAKDRPAALQHLRRRKEHERLRAQRLACLASSEALLLGMEGAGTDAEVLQAYRAGSGGLRAMLAALPSAGAVDDLLIAIQESLEEQAGVTQALAQPVEPAAVDELELEGELADLLLASLPSPPTPAMLVRPTATPPVERALHRVEDALEHLHLEDPIPQ